MKHIIIPVALGLAISAVGGTLGSHGAVWRGDIFNPLCGFLHGAASYVDRQIRLYAEHFNMRPEYYSDVYRRYSTYMRNQPGNTLYRIASGASDYDYNWTTVLMDRVGAGRMDGLSLHYYTAEGWNNKGTATAAPLPMLTDR